MLVLFVWVISSVFAGCFVALVEHMYLLETWNWLGQEIEDKRTAVAAYEQLGAAIFDHQYSGTLHQMRGKKDCHCCTLQTALRSHETYMDWTSSGPFSGDHYHANTAHPKYLDLPRKIRSAVDLDRQRVVAETLGCTWKRINGRFKENK